MCDTARQTERILEKARDITREQKEFNWIKDMQNQLNYHAEEIAKINRNIQAFQNSREVRNFVIED